MTARNRTILHGQRGASLAEMLVVVWLVGISAILGGPPLAHARRTWAMATTTRRVTTLMMRARLTAISEGRACSLVFERGRRGWRCFIARDNDGDGVNRRDLEAGIDTVLGERVELTDSPARLGILRGIEIPDPSGEGTLGGDLDDPVRAGRGDIVTFTRYATATPCSVYVTDGRSRMRVIRLFGPTARFRVLEWRAGWSGWQRAGW